MLAEHTPVVLTENIPDTGIEVGDVGVIIHIHAQGAAYEVEFMALNGETLNIQTLQPHQIREAGNRDIPHVRERIAA